MPKQLDSPYRNRSFLRGKFPGLPPFKRFQVLKDETSTRKPKYIGVHSWQGSFLALSPHFSKWVFWDDDKLFKVSGNRVHQAIFDLNAYLASLGHSSVFQTWYKKYDYKAKKWSFQHLFAKNQKVAPTFTPIPPSSRVPPRNLQLRAIRLLRRSIAHLHPGVSHTVAVVNSRKHPTFPGPDDYLGSTAVSSNALPVLHIAHPHLDSRVKSGFSTTTRRSHLTNTTSSSLTNSTSGNWMIDSSLGQTVLDLSRRGSYVLGNVSEFVGNLTEPWKNLPSPAKSLGLFVLKRIPDLFPFTKWTVNLVLKLLKIAQFYDDS